MNAPPLCQHTAGEETSPQIMSSPQIRAPRVVVIREEFIALTGNPLIAAVLNQLVYWSRRVNNLELFLREEKAAPPKCRSSLQHGWFYKTSSELIEETMLCVTPVTLRRYLTFLEERGWIETRTNPQNKWDKTTQYRVNLRRLSCDLEGKGYDLPGVLKNELFPSAQKGPSEEKEIEKSKFSREKKNEASKINNELYEDKETANSNGKKQSFEDLENEPSKEEKMTYRRGKNIGCNTEITTENTNREYTQRTRAHEDSRIFCFSEKGQGDSVSQAMVKLWQRQIRNEKLHLTKKRSHLLEATLQSHFENDLKKWEDFCVRIKGSSFLMGEGKHKWHATLDWILDESNLIKVLEGNFDNPEMTKSGVCFDEWLLGGIRTNPVKIEEQNSILSRIKDPVWKNWCKQLAAGVRFNERKMLQSPLSFTELQEISNAYFIECEEERLVWIGSADQSVLNKIEDLRTKITWVFEKDYPKARTFRTRLEPNPHHQDSFFQQQDTDRFEAAYSATPIKRGEIHA